ncbi:MAG: hypothetical protein MMC33_005533 [Icmadophila ericetorum]|nr:hypothetical protein [Icmadophila ericetorum]
MFILPFPRNYSLVAEKDDTEKDDIETSVSSPGELDIYQAQLDRTWKHLVIAILLLIASIASTVIGVIIGQRFPINLDAICTRHTSKYSPILDENIISYDVVQFDGRFIDENVYRQAGGLEVDAAWEALGVGCKMLKYPISLPSNRPIRLPDEQAAKAGLTKDHVHINPELGGGYAVFMEGMHQLHCLNLVRKSLYYNYDYYLAEGKQAFGEGRGILQWHVSHCLDFIRQRLMCTVDTGVFGAVWVNRSDPQQFVDFNTKHVCKNFDAIRAWAERNQMPEHLPDDFWEMPGEDVYIWPVAP